MTATTETLNQLLDLRLKLQVILEHVANNGADSHNPNLDTMGYEMAALLRQYNLEDFKSNEVPLEGTLRARALALYSGPFKFQRGYIFDAAGGMVSDDGDMEDIVARLRGWGRISYMKDPEELQDEVGKVIAEALSEFWYRAETAKLGNSSAVKTLAEDVDTALGK